MVVVGFVSCVGVRVRECGACVGESQGEFVNDLQEFGGDGLVGRGAVLDPACDRLVYAHAEDGHGGGGLVERCALILAVAANVDEDDGAAEWAGRAVGLQADLGHGRCLAVGQGDLGVEHHRPDPLG